MTLRLSAAAASSGTSQLAGFLRHVGEVFDVDLSVILWDGSVVPLCARPSSDLALKICDPGVIASLLRAPKLWTAIELLLNGRIRLVNGLFFAFEPRRQDIEDKIRAGRWRKISKLKALAALAPFLFASREAPGSISPERSPTGPRRGATTRRWCNSTTISPTISTRSSSIRAWSIPAPIFPPGTRVWRRRSGTSST